MQPQALLFEEEAHGCQQSEPGNALEARAPPVLTHPPLLEPSQQAEQVVQPNPASRGQADLPADHRHLNSAIADRADQLEQLNDLRAGVVGQLLKSPLADTEAAVGWHHCAG